MGELKQPELKRMLRVLVLKVVLFLVGSIGVVWASYIFFEVLFYRFKKPIYDSLLWMSVFAALLEMLLMAAIFHKNILEDKKK